MAALWAVGATLVALAVVDYLAHDFVFADLLTYEERLHSDGRGRHVSPLETSPDAPRWSSVESPASPPSPPACWRESVASLAGS